MASQQDLFKDIQLAGIKIHGLSSFVQNDFEKTNFSKQNLIEMIPECEKSFDEVIGYLQSLKIRSLDLLKTESEKLS